MSRPAEHTTHGSGPAEQAGGPDHASATRLARIALGHLVEPGNRDLGEIVRTVGPVEGLRRLRAGLVPPKLWQATAPRLAGVDVTALATGALQRAERLGARIITPEDDEYPVQLDDLVWISRDVADPIERDTYPPHCIWLRGPQHLARVCQRAVAVVGSRASTPYGQRVGADFAYALAERGWTIVSGGAFGIDAAAHRATLAADGCTVAVLACGIDRPYPQSHASMFDRIGDTGLLLSEWPPGADPHRRRFLIRNRVIAAASQSTMMVEANLRSGARFTLRRARELNRVTVAVPGPVTSALSVGCHEDIRENGTIMVASVAHVVDAIGKIGADLAPINRASAEPRDRLTPLQAQVLDGVRPRKLLSAEQIAVSVNVSDRDARRSLPALILAGFVVAQDGAYRLANKSDGGRTRSGQHRQRA